MKPAPTGTTPAVTLRTKTATTGILFMAGGIAGTLITTSVWTGPDPFAVILVLLALSTGAGIAAWGHLVPAWTFHVVVVAGQLLIGVAIVSTPESTLAIALSGLFNLCTIGVLYFFSGWRAYFHAVAQLLTSAVSLVWQGEPPGLVAAVMVLQLTLIVIVGRLIKRAADSVVDSLTGLPNRRGFEEHLERTGAESRRRHSPLAVALLDLDHFKAVNDRDGHQAGDALLTRLAAVWVKALPTNIFLSRHGGDEFALTAPGSSAVELADLCRRLTTLAAPASLSAGVAELGDDEDCGSLVRRADTALYQAKATGRSKTCIADPSDDALSAELATAIAGGAIDVALQPIVRPSTGELLGLEALARWHDAQRGWVSPATFIPLAERTAQINELGRTVLERACEGAERFVSTTGLAIFLSVNVSGQQLIREDFVDELAFVLKSTGWPATQLVLEVTESTVDIASAAAMASLERVRELGAAVAIDDFGTGYSAYSQLDALPADYLKLDAAFTADITTSSRRVSTLKALLDLCTQLDITVIAEGVESRAHAEVLTELGCPMAQGYYYARPSSLSEIMRDRQGSSETTSVR